MRLARHRHLDALCGEYLLGTLRGRARRRFERALREEPPVVLRLQYWQRTVAPRFAQSIAVEPSPAIWKRLRRELELDRYRTPWYGRIGFWRGWAAAATAALVLVLAFNVLPPLVAPGYVDVARLVGKEPAAAVTAAVSRDGTALRLRASRPVLAGPQHSYELWLIPREGGAPISLAVLGQLDAELRLPAAHAGRLQAGAKLAISVEPAGGSPTGAPTGPVILIGEISGSA
ncbi:MAG: anti-sigma factor domain-containing protein [Burkholderiaceae bacterium]